MNITTTQPHQVEPSIQLVNRQTHEVITEGSLILDGTKIVVKIQNPDNKSLMVSAMYSTQNGLRKIIESFSILPGGKEKCLRFTAKASNNEILIMVNHNALLDSFPSNISIMPKNILRRHMCSTLIQTTTTTTTTEEQRAIQAAIKMNPTPSLTRASSQLPLSQLPSRPISNPLKRHFPFLQNQTPALFPLGDTENNASSEDFEKDQPEKKRRTEEKTPEKAEKENSTKKTSINSTPIIFPPSAPMPRPVVPAVPRSNDMEVPLDEPHEGFGNESNRPRAISALPPPGVPAQMHLSLKLHNITQKKNIFWGEQIPEGNEVAILIKNPNPKQLRVRCLITKADGGEVPIVGSRIADVNPQKAIVLCKFVAERAFGRIKLTYATAMTPITPSSHFYQSSFFAFIAPSAESQKGNLTK